jgi:hypothetical protein
MAERAHRESTSQDEVNVSNQESGFLCLYSKQATMPNSRYQQKQNKQYSVSAQPQTLNRFKGYALQAEEPLPSNPHARSNGRQAHILPNHEQCGLHDGSP